MAQENSDQASSPATDRQWGWITRLAVGGGALVVVFGTAVLLVWIFGRPEVSVSPSGQALVQLHLGGIGTELSGVRATADGRTVVLVREASGLVPAVRLTQGEVVRIKASATPPSWLDWLLGRGVSATTTVRTPLAAPTSGVAVTSEAGQVAIHFDHPVRVVDYRSPSSPLKVLHLRSASTVVDLTVPSTHDEDSLQVAAAPRLWEPVAAPKTIVWFVAPTGHRPVVLAQPVPGSATATMTEPITLTFDEPVVKVLGDTLPTVSPKVAGTWSEPESDTLVFTPSDSGFGYGPSTEVTVRLPQQVTILGTTGGDTYHFQVNPGSLLRLEQILAELHYLPLNFEPSPGTTEPTTFAAEVATIDDPLAGTFSWRWSSVPATLQAEWSPGAPTAMVKGALMAFDATTTNYDGYEADDETVSQLANAATWKALLEDAIADKLDPSPYSYVYVSENLPETLTLWENGSVVLQSPANTGIAEEPTATGTYPIYVRYAENYMSGFNPDGSYYDDLVQWINYFNGGDAVHGFVRGSYGFPQSLGCVELPVPTAAAAFPRLAIGDLVTVVS